MKIRPLQLGGRLLSGKTLHGDYAIEVLRNFDGPVYDADGEQVGTVKMTIKTPPEAPPKVLNGEQKARMAARLSVCRQCEHMRGFGRATVACSKCKACRNKLSLISKASVCPVGRWAKA